MKGLACVRAASWMERRASGLTDGQRLAFEEHLSACEACAREFTLLEAMRQRVVAIEPQLTASAREAVVTAALARGAHSSVRAGARPTARLAMSLAAAALLGAAALALFALDRSGSAPTPVAGAAGAPEARAVVADARGASASSAPDTAPTTARVLGGALLDADTDVRLSAGQPAPAGAALRATEASVLQVGRARLALSAGAVLRLQADAEEVELLDGRLLADVDPASAKRRFAVRTRRFAAVVLGTRFEVTLEGVSVQRGHVRVEAPDATVLAADLGPGERFELEPELPAPAQDRADVPTRDAATLLADARRLLSAGRLARARRGIARALALKPAPGLRAEALSLQAEALLLDGHRTEAVRGYLEVAERFGKLAAGENALFAAARLEAEAGSARAEALLRRYLQRYPRGRFVREVRSRQHELSATPRP